MHIAVQLKLNLNSLTCIQHVTYLLLLKNNNESFEHLKIKKNFRKCYNYFTFSNETLLFESGFLNKYYWIIHVFSYRDVQ